MTRGLARHPVHAAVALLVVAAFFQCPQVRAGEATAESDSTRAQGHDKPVVGTSQSGYQTETTSVGGHSVENTLADDDKVKNSLVNVKFLGSNFYEFKRRAYDSLGLALGMDYNFLNQYATFSSSDTQGASGVFRFFGMWSPGGADKHKSGLVFRIQNKHLIGQGLTPRELGFDTGSALSTAGFTASGWGVSNLYWTQVNNNRRHRISIGHLKAGHFIDVYPFLSAWTGFMDDASYNNPTMAQPHVGFGIVYRGYYLHQFYFAAGIHDANGTPTSMDFNSFFKTNEYFSWAETGWSPDPANAKSGNKISVSGWQVNERGEAGVPSGRGLLLTAVKKLSENWSPFLRAGISDGEAALVKSMISLGFGANVRTSDFFGMAFSWAHPYQGQGREQLTWETLYQLQLTQNIEVTPGFQWTFHPAQNPDHESVFVASVVRFRVAF